MDHLIALRIIELALGILKGSTTGKTQDIAGSLLALEQIAAGVSQEYERLKGQPLDLSLLTYEPPIV